MKMISMAKTIGAVRDGIPIERYDWPTGSGFTIGTLAVADDPSRHFDIREGRLYKDVTRRGGWTKEKGKPPVWRRAWAKAKAGDRVVLVEWSPRVGPRWACACGWLGPTTATIGAGAGVHKNHGVNCGKQSNYRDPQSLGVRRIVSADAVRLGDIDEVDLIREGFPGMTAEEFVAMFCAPGKPYPDGEVTRLVLARDDGATKGAKAWRDP